ncbi:MAG: tetratricopeptide repeat protein [Gallionella sp.]|nr:tetratricopeptide repeat protein [Gallionella sp.]MDD4958335.1 tetratricopeptide repeat protein [Gallionella sp.]
MEIQSDYAEVRCGLGVALKELGQLDSAIASFRHAREINPDLVEARSNLGNVLGDLYNTGNALLDSGKLTDAVAELPPSTENQT